MTHQRPLSTPHIKPICIYATYFGLDNQLTHGSSIVRPATQSAAEERKAHKLDKKEKASRRKSYSAPALEKGLDILELLATEPEPINLKEIATRLGRSVGEIFRMLAVLEQRGYVSSKEETDRYSLSMKLFRLAHWHLPINRLTTAASGPMRRLALDTGQSCHLTILHGTVVVVIARQDSYADRSFGIRVGAESPILSSCSGRIFFSLAGKDRQQNLIRRLRAIGESVHDADKSKKAAVALKETGLLELPSLQVEGIIDMGTPIFDHEGSVAAALVIPFLHRIDKDNESEVDRIKKQLIAAAQAISEALGHDRTPSI